MALQTYVVEFSGYRAVLEGKGTISPMMNRGDVIEMAPFEIPDDSADMQACLRDYRHFVQQVVIACADLQRLTDRCFCYQYEPNCLGVCPLDRPSAPNCGCHG